MKPRKTYGRDQTEHRPTMPSPSLPYSECAFHGCASVPAEGLDFPLCPKHCRTVYLTVKDMLAVAEMRGHLEAAVKGGNIDWRAINGPPAHTSHTVGLVYFARVGDLIKIGYTTGLKERMKALGGEALATVVGTMAEEKAMQARFGPLWDHGEYFRPGRELMDYIKSIAVTQDTQRP